MPWRKDRIAMLRGIFPHCQWTVHSFRSGLVDCEQTPRRIERNCVFECMWIASERSTAFRLIAKCARRRWIFQDCGSPTIKKLRRLCSHTPTARATICIQRARTNEHGGIGIFCIVLPTLIQRSFKIKFTAPWNAEMDATMWKQTPRCDQRRHDVGSRCAVSNPATAKATQKNLLCKTL